MYEFYRIAITVIWILGVFLMFKRAYRTSYTGKALLWTALLIPFWGKFCDWAYEQVADRWDDPSFWLTDAFRPMGNWPPLFSWKVWLFIVIAILAFVVWRFSAPTAPGAPWGRLIVVTMMALVFLWQALSWDWYNMEAHAKYVAAPTITIDKPVVHSDGTVTLAVMHAPKGLKAPEYHWSLLTAKGGKVPDVDLSRQNDRKVVTPQLAKGNYQAFVTAKGTDGKASQPASRHFTVSSHRGSPPDNSADTGCQPTWRIDYGGTSTDNALVPGGVPSAKTASDSDTARQALLDQLQAIEPNPKKLAKAIELNLPGHPVVKVSDLVDGACASQTAAGYVVKIQRVINDPATFVTPGEAPKDGINTGWDGTEVVQNSSPGVRGDRKGVHMKLTDNTEYWMDWISGNWVFARDHIPIELPKGRAGTVEAAAATATPTPGQPAQASSTGSTRPAGSSSASTRRSATTSFSRTTATTTSSGSTTASRTTPATTTAAPTSGSNSAAPWPTWGNGPGPTTTRPAPTTAPLTTIPPVTEGSSPTPPSSTASPSASAYPTGGSTCDPITGNGC